MPTRPAALARTLIVAALSWPSGTTHPAAAADPTLTSSNPWTTIDALACEISEFPPKDPKHLPEISCR